MSAITSLKPPTEDSFSEVISTYNKIDVLVNNAAIMTFKKITELSAQEWDMVMAVNMRSVFLFFGNVLKPVAER